MINDRKEAYMAIEIGYQQFTLGCHRARRLEYSTKEIIRRWRKDVWHSSGQ